MEDFKWTDSLVKEFQIFYNKIPYAITGIDPIKKGIEMFKESKEKKEVLFTTEDGVGIHEGDTYYTLEPDNNWYLYYSGAAGDGSGKRTIAKYFSTKEAAEDWVLYHKPMLSVKDVYKVCNRAWIRGEGNPTSNFDRELKELAKSKLLFKL